MVSPPALLNEAKYLVTKELQIELSRITRVKGCSPESTTAGRRDGFSKAAEHIEWLFPVGRYSRAARVIASIICVVDRSDVWSGYVQFLGHNVNGSIDVFCTEIVPRRHFGNVHVIDRHDARRRARINRTTRKRQRSRPASR